MGSPDPLDLAAMINGLPEPLRQYVHDLETGCDPAGEVRELFLLRQEREIVIKDMAEKDTVIEALRAALEAIPDFAHTSLCNQSPCRCYVGKRQAALALVHRRPR